MKCLRKYKPGVMAGACGKNVGDEAAEFARTVVTEGLNVTLRSSSSSMYVACAAIPDSTFRGAPCLI